MLLHAALSATMIAAAPTQDGSPSPLLPHIEACERGRSTLEALCEHLAPPRHRMQATVETRSVTLRHGRRPDDHGSRHVLENVRVFEVQPSLGEGPAWRLDAEMRLADPAAANRPADRVRVNDLFAIEDREGGLGPALEGADALRAQIVHRAPFPAALAHYVNCAGTVLGSESTAEGGVHVLVQLEGGRALIRTVPVPYSLDETEFKVPGLVGIDWVTHSELLGDVVESLTYSDAPSPAPGLVGGWTITGPLGTGDVAEVTDFELDSEVLPFEGGLFPDPEAQSRGAGTSAASIELREIGDGAFELLIPAESARCVALDLGPGWAVLEVPVSSAIGEALIQKLEEEKPGHPFLYAAASHHHPHYIGGMRPFVHRGASVVCPAEVATYIEHVLTRSRTLEPDALARSRKTPRIESVEPGQRWAPREAPDRLIAVEADGHSAHTEAFMLFFLPEHDLAFGGDLLWLSTDESPRGPNPRTLGLKKILSDADDLKTSEFLTSWPAGGAPMRGRVWKDRVPVAEILAAR